MRPLGVFECGGICRFCCSRPGPGERLWTCPAADCPWQQRYGQCTSCTKGFADMFRVGPKTAPFDELDASGCDACSAQHRLNARHAHRLGVALKLLEELDGEIRDPEIRDRKMGWLTVRTVHRRGANLWALEGLKLSADATKCQPVEWNVVYCDVETGFIIVAQVDWDYEVDFKGIKAAFARKPAKSRPCGSKHGLISVRSVRNTRPRLLTVLPSP